MILKGVAGIRWLKQRIDRRGANPRLVIDATSNPCQLSTCFGEQVDAMSYNPEQSEGGITVGNGAFLFQEAARTPMNQALAHVTVARPEVSELSIAAAGDALRSGWLGYGPRCQELEQTFCSRRGGWAVATQSCTACLLYTS